MDTQIPTPRLEHLRALTGPYGLWEHALYDTPRPGHGYTTDDNARALVVLGGMPDEGVPPLEPYLDFVVRGRVPVGWHNRLSDGGEWIDLRGSDDAHGRALWGLGRVLARGWADADATAAFLAGLNLDTCYSRANAYAVLGGVTVFRHGLLVDELDGFLARVGPRLARPAPGGWMWPEPRLTYDNARLPQALIELGEAQGDLEMVADGLELLDWLVAVESGSRGFSFTPVAGRGPDDGSPAFDQQPIEAWAMADACLSASMADGDSRWRYRLEGAVRWFLGENDVGVPLLDPETGAGFDGLQPEGVNLNRGAESTLAAQGALVSWWGAQVEIVQ